MKYKNIYVLTPFNYCTGGVELAHQLVSRLRDFGENAYIVYANPPKGISVNQEITPNYAKYNIKTTNIIEDDRCNFLVIPEIYFEYAGIYKKIIIGCWWMSVDNRYKRACFKDKFLFLNSFYARFKFVCSYLKRKLKGDYVYTNSNWILFSEDDRIIHLYQSHYAQYHLYSKGVCRLAPLSDYINTELLGDSLRERENIVLYNPAKGKAFTEKIIRSLPDIRFIPLKGLSRKELQELLGKSKLYIDFGHFPGKDRLPREAVVNGCCIITGKNGASYFYEDVPIGSRYKFDTKNSNIPQIAECIEYVLNNYDKCKVDFDDYRKIVLAEEETFYKEIDELFC